MGRALFVVGLLVGCGGVGDGNVNRNEQGRLEQGDGVIDTDNSFYDTFEFGTKQGHQITLTMRSTEFNTYLILFDPEQNKVGENDDAAAAGGTNSQIQIRAPSEGQYRVYANSQTSGMTGAYTLNIVAGAPGATPAAPAPGAAPTPPAPPPAGAAVVPAPPGAAAPTAPPAAGAAAATKN